MKTTQALIAALVSGMALSAVRLDVARPMEVSSAMQPA